MEYGIPYMGSKNTIAEQIVKAMPCGKRFLDACCGGGAIMQAAAMSGRWERVVASDINPAVIKLLDAIFINKGQIDYEHPEPCTRQDFYNSLQRIENGDFTIQDCINKYCGSFGNSGKTFIYGKSSEEIKTTADIMLTSKKLKERRKYYRKFVKMFKEDDGRIQRLEELERLERLERLEISSIFERDFKGFDVIYFDIPYRNTAKYDFNFDHDKFYELFKSLPVPAFFSEYDGPFTCVTSIDKSSNLGPNTVKIEGKEKLYFNGSMEQYKALMGREYQEKTEQLTIF